MRVLINALSVSNASGRHVLLGHLSRFAAWTAGRHEFRVLYNRGNQDLCRDLGSNVRWIACPDVTRHWLARSWWERASLPALVRAERCEAVFSPAGIVTPSLRVPQVAFAQNPWALVRGLTRTAGERIKAALQRAAYRDAIRRAALMVFNSRYMHDAYRENAGVEATNARVIYQGVDDETFTSASTRHDDRARNALQIVSVSAMAPHKGVETVVSAVHRLRTEYGIPATLLVVGGWPDARYRSQIESLVAELSLSACIRLAGHVRREELETAYAESKVFCLMSRCESFGIPAIEAQAFGTPVVSSNCCAIPEICGDGGLFPEPGDVPATAAALARLLGDEGLWSALSSAARANAEKFRWDRVSRPFETLFDELGGR